MRKEYDFSKGVRGKFYKRHDSLKIIINYGKIKKQPVFEIYKDKNNQFIYRLKDETGKILMSSEVYSTKTACLKNLRKLREKSAIANIVENSAMISM